MFSKNKNCIDGHMSICKLCRSLSRKQLNYDIKTDDKTCMRCNMIKPYTDFYKDKSASDGLQSYCKDCGKIINKEYYEKHGTDVYFKKLYKDLLKNAERRNIDVCITLEDIINLYNNKNTCNISGIKMTTQFVPYEGRTNRIYNVSVDRIDSKKSYNKDNIQLVCSIVNTMKWDLVQEDFINICKHIYMHNC
jgi:hypothetical protein